MKPAELREAIAYLGLSQQEAARRLSLSPSHFRKLIAGKHAIQGPTEVAIRLMIELKELTGVTPDLADMQVLRRTPQNLITLIQLKHPDAGK